MTYPKATYMKAARVLAEQFQDQKGGEKNDTACKMKFSALKTSYHAAADLRFGGSSSGSMWTDDGGLAWTIAQLSAWVGYVKSHPHAKQFQNKRFLHFTIFNLLAASSTAKGIHVHWIQRQKAGSTLSGTN
ncbi:uncharacterized protein BJ212DRAFT_1299872 [Suillus subaureus]|uniref:Uncharacterized protein n=1 Tax=Suillus subaureus TaxID=48587 RepID=A0A9P7AM64_9AGAM|nr:uncharacterized protein BJ212DRAFT_1307341 [Suillus subaureus]XP_041192830.1 uncharacterized protein BJ212DRAFT_1299872 [Suillus subaureus]KAG1792390.1 hypothetical protein BJ212DRAFT_1307341 [Suillus subaureus]KAG1816024.1 hypothetical protein BJ212DRAFT_1299872 [Suillus subaureus]